MVRFVFEHRYIGQEFDWIALDDAGNIGQFATAGVAPIPKICTEKGELYEDLFEDLMALSENTEVNIDSSQSDKDISDWIQISQRGIYSYDWSYTNNRYERLCSPVEPLSVAQLPDELRATASQIVVPDSFTIMLFLPVTV